jgi:uncharacterized protein
MNPVVHFEMGANDTARMQAFYQTAFGWQTQQLGDEMGGYVLVSTAETDEKGMVKTPGTINGGFYKKTEDPTSHAPSVVIAVTNLDEMMEKVKAAGGKILRDPDDIPGVGKWVSFQDTEGNRVSMMQPLIP